MRKTPPQTRASFRALGSLLHVGSIASPRDSEYSAITHVCNATLDTNAATITQVAAHETKRRQDFKFN